VASSPKRLFHRPVRAAQSVQEAVNREDRGYVCPASKVECKTIPTPWRKCVACPESPQEPRSITFPLLGGDDNLGHGILPDRQRINHQYEGCARRHSARQFCVCEYQAFGARRLTRCAVALCGSVFEQSNREVCAPSRRIVISRGQVETGAKAASRLLSLSSLRRKFERDRPAILSVHRELRYSP